MLSFFRCVPSALILSSLCSSLVVSLSLAGLFWVLLKRQYGFFLLISFIFKLPFAIDNNFIDFANRILMNNSLFSYNTHRQDSYYRGRDVLHFIQAPLLTHKVVSSGPGSNTKIDNYEWKEFSTSNSLGSYKYLSPLKGMESAPDAYENCRKLAQIAIQKKWTKEQFNTKWQEFMVAQKSYDSKAETAAFFKNIVTKQKKRPKSDPGRKPQKSLQIKEHVQPHHYPTLQRFNSYSIQIPHEVPQKQPKKSKSQILKSAQKAQQVTKSTKNEDRQQKLLRLCEAIESGLSRGHQRLINRRALF